MYACIDSALFIVKANNINPTWLMVLYANNLFILNCVKPKTDPITRENKLLNNSIFFQEKFK